MKLAPALVFAATLSSIFTLPLHTTTSTPNRVTTRQIETLWPGHKGISVEGGYDVVVRTLSARIFDGEAETCTINAVFDSSVTDASSTLLNFYCLDGYAATILGDMTGVRYSAPGSGGMAIVLKRGSVVQEGKRNFVRSGQVETEWGVEDNSVDEVAYEEVAVEAVAVGIEVAVNEGEEIAKPSVKPIIMFEESQMVPDESTGGEEQAEGVKIITL